LPDPLPAARPPITDLPPSDALSILNNGPESFAGRKIGVLATDGVDAAILDAIRATAEQRQVNIEIVAPTVGGISTRDGTRIPADQKVDGGPSVVYAAVVVLASAEGASALARLPAARDFVTDAYAHCKFIGYVSDVSA